MKPLIWSRSSLYGAEGTSKERASVVVVAAVAVATVRDVVAV